MHLSLLDVIVIAAYLLGPSLAGFNFSKPQNSEVAYFLGNRRLPWPIVGLSVMATLISTLTYLSYPGEMIAHRLGGAEVLGYGSNENPVFAGVECRLSILNHGVSAAARI